MKTVKSILSIFLGFITGFVIILLCVSCNSPSYAHHYHSQTDRDEFINSKSIINIKQAGKSVNLSGSYSVLYILDFDEHQYLIVSGNSYQGSSIVHLESCKYCNK